jgi:hypothetical protein
MIMHRTANARRLAKSSEGGAIIVYRGRAETNGSGCRIAAGDWRVTCEFARRLKKVGRGLLYYPNG